MPVNPNACGHFDVEEIRKYLTEHNTINKIHIHTRIIWYGLYFFNFSDKYHHKF